MERIREECRVKVAMIENRTKRRICFRGLTHHTSEYREQAEAARDRVYSVVHTVQEFANSSGRDASNLLGRMVRRASADSVQAALSVAHEDARCVMRMRMSWTLSKTMPSSKSSTVHLVSQQSMAKSPAGAITKALVQNATRGSLSARTLERHVPILSPNKTRSSKTNSYLSQALNIIGTKDGNCVALSPTSSIDSRE